MDDASVELSGGGCGDDLLEWQSGIANSLCLVSRDRLHQASTSFAKPLQSMH
jgi:hypothetical protein